MPPEVHDERYLAEAAREMVSSFKAQRFQHVVALFDQLMQSKVGTTPAELLDQLAAAGGKNLKNVLTRSYAYGSCWFCETGMAHCETCDGSGLVDEELFCADCHGLGKLRCTVCRGSSFVILDEIPEYFRGPVVEERLNLAERAYAEVKKKFEAFQASGGRSAAPVRKVHHQNQQVLGVLHNCRAQMTQHATEEQINKFNSMVRGVQETYHGSTAMCARGCLEAARRLLAGDHPVPGRPQGNRLVRSIEHHLAVARGYTDILKRAGNRAVAQELESETQDLERGLRAEGVQQMVVPVGEAAGREPPKPRPKRPEPETPAVIEFTEKFTEEQIQEVAELFEQEYWTHNRPLEWVRQAIRDSTISIAITRREGKRRKVVGYVRALSDGVLKAVVCDFVIAKESRGAGMGKLLMSQLISHSMMSKVRDIEVACLPEAVGMFKQWGFSENVDGLVLLRYVRVRR